MNKIAKRGNLNFTGVRGKKKIIKLRNSESIMDGNSVQMPFIAPYRGEPLTYVEYQWTVVENGSEITRGINVHGHGKLGVPTLKDKEVLRALQDIYIWSKIQDGVLELETNISKITEDDLMIDFGTIDKIATEMGYKKISGQQRHSIKESIERLVAATMFSTHNGGLYDPITKKYIANSKESYRYLQGMKDYTLYDCDNCLYSAGCNKNFDECISPNKKTDVTKIRMDLFFYLSIANNYRLYYNKDNAKVIKNLISRNIYMISRKWLGDGFVSKVNIKKYLDRIPMNAAKEKHRKQKIREGVQKLNEYDFVEAYLENDIVTVIHLDKKATYTNNNLTDKIATKDTTYMKDKFIKFSDFKKGLEDIGFNEEEFDKYIDLQKIDHLRALLRYIYIYKNYHPDINAKEYIINCINKDIVVDKKYYDQAE